MVAPDPISNFVTRKDHRAGADEISAMAARIFPIKGPYWSSMRSTPSAPVDQPRLPPAPRSIAGPDPSEVVWISTFEKSCCTSVFPTDIILIDKRSSPRISPQKSRRRQTRTVLIAFSSCLRAQNMTRLCVESSGYDIVPSMGEEPDYDRDLGVIEAITYVTRSCPSGVVVAAAEAALDAIKAGGSPVMKQQAYLVLTTMKGWRGERATQVHRSLTRYLEQDSDGPRSEERRS
jgi:hypothetical protein